MERFEAGLRELIALGPRLPGSEAITAARLWARENTPAGEVDGGIVLAAPLGTGDVDGAALLAESSGLALAIEVARALAAGGAPAHVAAIEGETASDPQLRGAPLVVFVKRACGVPQRRDLLSNRVLRERFFELAGVEAVAFEQSDAPHAALRAAGARRVIALDAPPREGEVCRPGRFGDALLAFVRDASGLLARRQLNPQSVTASQTGS